MEKLTDLWWQFYYWADAQPVFVQVAIGIAIFLLAIPFLGVAFILAGVSVNIVYHGFAAIVVDAREHSAGLRHLQQAFRWRYVVFFVAIPALVVLVFLLVVA